MQMEKISVRVPDGLPASMVVEYVQRCNIALPAAEAALANLDHNYLRIFGHGLKGSGGGYGIPGLTQAGSLIEEAAKSGDTAELQEQLAHLAVYLSQIEILPG
jgi:HPt (histidine-containing phosphotransfer) domain-containing protein